MNVSIPASGYWRNTCAVIGLVAAMALNSSLSRAQQASGAGQPVSGIAGVRALALATGTLANALPQTSLLYEHFGRGIPVFTGPGIVGSSVYEQLGTAVEHERAIVTHLDPQFGHCRVAS